MFRAFRVALALALALTAVSLRQARAGTEQACDFDPDNVVCIDNFCAINGGDCILNWDHDGCLCQIVAEHARAR